MCGIAGLVGVPYNENILKKMVSTMLHRGPDSKGMLRKEECVLLHSRLAIVDLAGGVQPMELCCAGECYTIVYNGELYNTQEVKNELKSLGHSFRTHSDTEVVLHAYAQWKAECLKRAIRQKQLERQLQASLTEETVQALADELARLAGEENT